MAENLPTIRFCLTHNRPASLRMNNWCDATREWTAPQEFVCETVTMALVRVADGQTASQQPIRWCEAHQDHMVHDQPYCAVWQRTKLRLCQAGVGVVLVRGAKEKQ